MKFIIRSLKHLIWKIFQMLKKKKKQYSSEVRQIQKLEKAMDAFSGL